VATEAPPTRRHWIVEFYGSTVGKKWVMAITGIILMVYVIAHMVGNLKVFLPAEMVDGELVADIDIYAEFLRELLVPIAPHAVVLWIMRLGLIAATVLHVEAMISLTRRNLGAKPTRYQHQDFQAATYAAKTMRFTGPIVLAFVVFHLLDLTWGVAPFNPEFIQGEVAHNLVVSLTRTGWVIFYVIANLALGFHLWHGAWSMFQSLGWNNPRFNRARDLFAYGFTVVVVGGNLLILAGIYFGFTQIS
jgi:succinate dehydrogenase / fumarate reductase cytochrome b subunit